MSISDVLAVAMRDGAGMDCDVSLFDTAVAMLTYPAVWALNGDFQPTRTHHSAHPSLVPFQAFQAADGWLVVACPKEKFWARLAAAIGHPELSADGRFASFAARRRNEDADDVLHHLLGYDDQRIGELSHGGVFGQAAR
jgi:crotonobetainyl-CoA:carnitine CoA-transferase CaiB-like acyl-CoA transferase